MISLEKWLILRPLQKLPKNGEDLGNLIAAQGFKKLSKVQYIAQSGHTVGITMHQYCATFLGTTVISNNGKKSLEEE